MIISEEQVRRAVEYLQTTDRTGVVEPGVAPDLSGVSAELVDRVRIALATAPDFRADRVAQAKELLAGGPLASADIAEKMIGRIISDSIR